MAATADLQSVLRVVDAETATALRLRGGLQVLPDGEEREVELWLTRAGAMRLEVDGAVEMVSDGASLWTRGEPQWQQEPANRPPGGDQAVRLVSPFDLVEALLPMPLGLADAPLLLERDADQLRLVLVRLESEPLVPRRAVTLTPDGLVVRRRQRYDDGGEVLRLDYAAPGVLQMWRVGSGASLRLRIVDLERDPVLAPGSFTPPG